MGKKCNLHSMYKSKVKPKKDIAKKLHEVSRKVLGAVFNGSLNAARKLGAYAGDSKVMKYLTDDSYKFHKVTPSKFQVKLIKPKYDNNPNIYVLGVFSKNGEIRVAVKKEVYGDKRVAGKRPLIDLKLDVMDVPQLKLLGDEDSEELLRRLKKEIEGIPLGVQGTIQYYVDEIMPEAGYTPSYVEERFERLKNLNGIKTDNILVPIKREEGIGAIHNVYTAVELDSKGNVVKEHPIDYIGIDSIDPIYIAENPQKTLFNITRAYKEGVEEFGNTTKAGKKGRKRQYKIQKEIDSDNVVEVASELNENSLTKASEEHENRLFRLLERVAKKDIVPTTKLYLAKNASVKAVEGYYRFVSDENTGSVYLTDKKTPVAKNEMSMLETYSHEIIHAIIRYGLNMATPEFAAIRRDIENIRRAFIENNTWEVFLNGINKDDASKKEIKRAKAAWEYIQGEHGLEEFITHGLTNESVASTLEKTRTSKYQIDPDVGLWTQLYYKFITMLDGIRNRLDGSRNYGNDHDALVAMVMELGTANERADISAKRNKWKRPIGALNDAIVGKTSELMNKSMSKFGDEWVLNYKNSSVPMRVLKSIGALAMLQSHKSDNVKNVFYGLLDSVNMKYGGVMQQLIRSLTDPTEYESTIEKLGLLSAKIDVDRENVALTMSKYVQEAFEGDLTSKVSEQLFYNIAKTDLQALSVYGISVAKIRKAMIDRYYRKELLSELNEKIKEVTTKTEYNIINNQMDGLAHYMVYNKSNEAQQPNAEGIVRSVDSSRVADTKLIKLVDALTSLKALNLVGSKYPLDVDFVNKHKQAIDTVVALFKAYDSESSTVKFENGKYNKVKGYSVQRGRNDIDVKYGLASDEEKFKREGYIKSFPVGEKVGSKEIYVYINKFPVGDKFNRQAIRLTDTKVKGTDLMSIVRTEHTGMDVSEFVNKYKYLIEHKKKYKNLTEEEVYKEITKELTKVYKKAIDKVRNAKLALYAKDPNAFKNGDKEVVKGLIPSYDKDGSVLTYRATMDSEAKEELFALDTNIESVIGATFARTLDIAQTKEHNKNIMNILFKDYKENFTSPLLVGKNNMRYVMIKPAEAGKEKGYWELLPKDMRYRFGIEAEKLYKKNLKEKTYGLKVGSPEYLRVMSEVKKNYYGVPIREDILRYIFGERDISIVNAGIIKGLPVVVRNTIAMLEKLWKDTVQVAKTNIIVKLPAVAISNIVSNTVLTFQFGLDGSKVIKYNKEALQELTNYQNNVKEITILRHNLTAKRRVKVKGKLLTLKDMQYRLNMLEENNKLSSVHDLIVNGGYLSLVEELLEDDEFSNNKLIQGFNAVRNKLPKAAQVILDYGTLSSHTIIHKSMAKSLQYSDFATKYAIYQFKYQEAVKAEETRLRRKLTQNELLNIRKKVFSLANDAVINYNKLDNNYLKYANDIGFLMFTKFAIGAQRTIKNLFKENPVNSLITEAIQALTYGVDDMLDSNLFGLNYLGRVHNPLDVLDSAFYTIYELPEDITRATSILK